jgi:hypothetical protein
MLYRLIVTPDFLVHANVPNVSLDNLKSMSTRQLSHGLLESIIYHSDDLLRQIIMTLTETLQLLRIKEKESGSLLKHALSLQRNCVSSQFKLSRNPDAFPSPAVNSKARIKWGTTFIRKIFDFFRKASDKDGSTDPLFLVTIAHKSHLTTDQPQQINLAQVKRQIGAGLMGLSYIGMIEPGYYNVIYEKFGNQRKNVISWHGHFLVWGATDKRLAKNLAKIKPGFTPIAPGLCAVHKKRIPADQFGYKLWYILKAPRKEYSMGQRRECDGKTGAARFKQNSRKIRPGNRVKLFHLMRDMYLDKLAMAGGEGSELLRRIKYDALREYRTKNGRDDRRP